MNKIKIGRRLIGENHPCFIVAEAGFNHNGKLSIAKEMIQSAADCEVDAVQ